MGSHGCPKERLLLPSFSFFLLLFCFLSCFDLVYGPTLFVKSNLRLRTGQSLSCPGLRHDKVPFDWFLFFGTFPLKVWLVRWVLNLRPDLKMGTFFPAVIYTLKNYLNMVEDKWNYWNIGIWATMSIALEIS